MPVLKCHSITGWIPFKIYCTVISITNTTQTYEHINNGNSAEVQCGNACNYWACIDSEFSADM